MDDLAEDHLRRWAQLDPSLAVYLGVDTPSGSLTDYSPSGLESRADLERSTLATLNGIELTGDSDRVASESMRERLRAELDLFESQELLREVRPIFSPLASTRMVFDVLPRSTAQDWEELAARMESVPVSLGGYRATPVSYTHLQLLARDRFARRIGRVQPATMRALCLALSVAVDCGVTDEAFWQGAP